MTVLALHRGEQYTLPEPACVHCGDRHAVYLFQPQRTRDERRQGRFRAVFQCCLCHGTRVVQFKESAERR